MLTPVLLMIVFAAFDLGLTYHDYVATTDAVRSAGRSAAIQGDNLMADHDVLASLGEDLDSTLSIEIDRIIVWHASGPGASAPAACASAVPGAGVAGVCNVYGPQHLSMAEDQFGCDPTPVAPAPPDRFWCPTDRDTSLAGGSDYLGIRIDVERPYATGLFGSGTTFSASTIVRLEPEDDSG